MDGGICGYGCELASSGKWIAVIKKLGTEVCKRIRLKFQNYQGNSGVQRFVIL